MQADQRICLKPDKAGRFLVIVFCLAPVLVPALAMSIVMIPRYISAPARAAGVDIYPARTGSLPGREQFISVCFGAPALPLHFFTDQNQLERNGFADHSLFIK